MVQTPDGNGRILEIHHRNASDYDDLGNTNIVVSTSKYPYIKYVI